MCGPKYIDGEGVLNGMSVIFKNISGSRNMTGKVFPVLFLCGAAMCVVANKAGLADDDGIPDLAHPLVAESPTPDTELRFEYILIETDTADELEINPEGEFAIMPGVSIEVDIPYKFRDPSDGSGSQDNLDVAEIALKLARGMSATSLLGGGLEVELPTGDDGKDIGSNNELIVKPFLDGGFIDGSFEYIGFFGLEFPFNQDSLTESEKDLGLEYNLAMAYWLQPRLRGIFEVDGELVVIGDDNESVINASWGAIGSPIKGVPLEVGIGMSVPITRDRDFDQKAIISLLYQF